MADWDFEIAFELEKDKKIEDEIQKLRYNFKDIIKDVNLLKIEKEHYLSGFVPKESISIS